ncbi:hypothetical protein COT78_01900 [Candidatus Berkelbacteria bacterium CG10_big_fil_rev_8_21_14_0_10_43_13]|uniref:Uncharacterized protein n=1 Tax=Candidatus Berkelbacteria bacterium CG10_big_fil_rev_8_21_14_0_10_43_13 TaxID=1974514 RepID=A0A2H0W6S3_9BACT|nr:MAG: hypothetical protein COT78_01900 [Candidatus Berkelbacteria bacterium CG10_big_fil_rev_8_21_14_0_10_43_13]
MNHQELYKLLVTVQKNVHCPQCGKSYNFSNIQIRGIVDTIIFLELSCAGHMPLLATVTMSKKNVVDTKNKVNSDDVIEMYRFLKDFDGSFEHLFKENSTNNKK